MPWFLSMLRRLNHFMTRSVSFFKIEPMQPDDIPAVVAVEQASYSMTWPPKAYDYELKQNKLAHYFVLRVSPSRSTAAEQESSVIGLGGFWLLSDEVHINTIAVHPTWRDLGLGEWLLITLLEEGQALSAEVATLEVRPSNHTARRLYQKYGFEQVGQRPHYYSDNDEDALILTTPPLASPDYQTMLHQRRANLFVQLNQININKNQKFD
jgi:[ribosomal protein S18]-alanine N-acetyltransferase